MLVEQNSKVLHKEKTQNWGKLAAADALCKLQTLFSTFHSPTFFFSPCLIKINCLPQAAFTWWIEQIHERNNFIPCSNLFETTATCFEYSSKKKERKKSISCKLQMAFISVTQLNAPYFLDCSLAIQIISLAALIILSLLCSHIYMYTQYHWNAQSYVFWAFLKSICIFWKAIHIL